MLPPPGDVYRYPTEMTFTQFRLIAAFLLTFLPGCGREPTEVQTLPAAPDLLLRPPPDFVSGIGDIAEAGELPAGGLVFRIAIDSDGRIFRDGRQSTFDKVCNELKGLTGLPETTLVINGTSDVQISTVFRIQSDLADIFPDLGPVIYTVDRVPDGG